MAVKISKMCCIRSRNKFAIIQCLIMSLKILTNQSSYQTKSKLLLVAQNILQNCPIFLAQLVRAPISYAGDGKLESRWQLPVPDHGACVLEHWSSAKITVGPMRCSLPVHSAKCTGKPYAYVRVKCQMSIYACRNETSGKLVKSLTLFCSKVLLKCAMTGITRVANYCDQLEQNSRKQKFKFTFIYSMKYTFQN